MKSTSPIILIDDDEEDCMLFEEACLNAGLENTIMKFTNSQEALIYLSDMILQPFFIMCDVNMPAINGLELRNRINSNEKLRLKAVPFLMWSTSGSGALIHQAFSLNIQGFFKKPTNIKDLVEIICSISKYWKHSMRP